jgi:hypothetical protein
MGSNKLQKQEEQDVGNKWIVERWEKELQEYDRDDLILEIIGSWKEQGLNGYK